MITKAIALRLDEEMKTRIGKCARQMGVTSSAVMRFAIVNQLAEIEGGVVRIRKAFPAAEPEVRCGVMEGKR